MSRTIRLIALALAAAAVAAPFAQAVTGPAGNQVVDPLAASYLRGQGFSSAEVKAQTVGVDPLAASYIRNHGFPQAITAKSVDPLAASYLRNNGFPQVAAKKAVDSLAASYIRNGGIPQAITTKSVDPLAASYLRNNGFPQASTPVGVTTGGFNWSDAGIGAAATLGAVLLLAGLGAGLGISRMNRRREIAST